MDNIDKQIKQKEKELAALRNMKKEQDEGAFYTKVKEWLEANGFKKSASGSVYTKTVFDDMEMAVMFSEFNYLTIEVQSPDCYVLEDSYELGDDKAAMRALKTYSDPSSYIKGTCALTFESIGINKRAVIDFLNDNLSDFTVVERDVVFTPVK